VLLAGNPAIAYGAGVGAGAWTGLYACGRVKLREYSPVLSVPLSGGACDFFSAFRIGIFCLSEVNVLKSTVRGACVKRGIGWWINA
jgi:hypothetical protein